MKDEWVAKSIQLSLQKLGKDISHLSITEIEEKSKQAFEKVKDIDINKKPNEYLKVVYEVFEV